MIIRTTTYNRRIVKPIHSYEIDRSNMDKGEFIKITYPSGQVEMISNFSYKMVEIIEFTTPVYSAGRLQYSLKEMDQLYQSIFNERGTYRKNREVNLKEAFQKFLDSSFFEVDSSLDSDQDSD